MHFNLKTRSCLIRADSDLSSALHDGIYVVASTSEPIFDDDFPKKDYIDVTFTTPSGELYTELMVANFEYSTLTKL